MFVRDTSSRVEGYMRSGEIVKERRVDERTNYALNAKGDRQSVKRREKGCSMVKQTQSNRDNYTQKYVFVNFTF